MGIEGKILSSKISIGRDGVKSQKNEKKSAACERSWKKYLIPENIRSDGILELKSVVGGPNIQNYLRKGVTP